MSYEIKRNDRRPRYRVALTANDDPVDLTNAVAARFSMKSASALKITRQPMTFIDRVNGIVEYAWGATDTDTSGDFNAEVEVDWGGSEYQTFPSRGFFLITITDDLA